MLADIAFVGFLVLVMALFFGMLYLIARYGGDTARFVLLLALAMHSATPLKAADDPKGADDLKMFKWESVVDYGREDYAMAVAVSGQTVLAAHMVQWNNTESVFNVRATDAVTGQLRWEDYFLGETGFLGYGQLATSGDYVFVSGHIAGAQASTTDIFILAYRISTGEPLWSHVWNAGRDDFPQGLAAANGYVTVFGYGGNAAPGEHLHGLIRTFNMVTGSVVWTEISTRGIGRDDAVWFGDTNGLVLIAAGTSVRLDGATEMVIRGYDVRDGRLLWTNIRQNAVGTPKILNGRLYIATNVITGPGTYIGLIAAYDIWRGTIVWETIPIAGFFNSIATSDAQVVAAGSVGNGLYVQSIDPMNGATLWQDYTMPAKGYRDMFAGLAITDNGVYLNGYSGQDYVYGEMMLRAYSRIGVLRQDDRSHKVGGTSIANKIAASGKWLATAGYAYSYTRDSVVRTYDTTPMDAAQ